VQLLDQFIKLLRVPGVRGLLLLVIFSAVFVSVTGKFVDDQRDRRETLLRFGIDITYHRLLEAEGQEATEIYKDTDALMATMLEEARTGYPIMHSILPNLKGQIEGLNSYYHEYRSIEKGNSKIKEEQVFNSFYRELLEVQQKYSMLANRASIVAWIAFALAFLVVTLASLRASFLLESRKNRDILAELEAKNQRANEARLRFFLDQSSGLTAVVNGEQQIVYNNRAFIEALGRDAIGVSPEELLHPEDLQRLTPFDTFFERYLIQQQQERPEPLRLRVRHRDQSWRVLDIHLFNALADPIVRGILVSAIDLTDILAAEEAQAASKAKTEFLSRMSHELRTPLNAISGFGQLLELDAQTESQREFVGYILKASKHLVSLVDEVLDITRIEAGRLTVSLEPVPLLQVLKESLSLVMPLAAERQISLIADDFDANLHLFGDRKRLAQILVNLFSNAIKYNKIGGQVIFSVEKTNRTVRLRVRDTGQGILPAHLPRLFQPFERLGAESSAIEGTGIGLALSQKLAELMQGRIEVESQVGEGSTFSLILQQAEAHGQRLEKVLGDIQPGRAGKVIYIEDNASNLDLMRLILEKRGLGLISTMQGRIGIDLVRQHRPDLLLLDLNLPDISGAEVLKMLRAQPETAGLPIIVVSADAMPRRIDELLAQGASAYITKPFQVTELLAAIDRLMLDH
jgi:PAS domain S-box-containing protein